jgi:hypothetical protein
MVQVMAPISLGELIDKITILEIKLTKLSKSDQLHHVQQELTLLNNILSTLNLPVKEHMDNLSHINSQIWDNEHDARIIMYGGLLSDNELICLAKIAASTYAANTTRARVKRDVNQLFHSNIVETKSYFKEINS